jgi:hypothetical protein
MLTGILRGVEERPDDLELVRLLLARQRAHGASFDEAWEMALSAIPPFDEYPRLNAHIDRDQTRAVLAATRPWWQAAYERQAPPPPQYRQAALAERLRAMMAEAGAAVAA